MFTDAGYQFGLGRIGEEERCARGLPQARALIWAVFRVTSIATGAGYNVLRSAQIKIDKTQIPPVS